MQAKIFIFVETYLTANGSIVVDITKFPFGADRRGRAVGLIIPYAPLYFARGSTKQTTGIFSAII